MSSAADTARHQPNIPLYLGIFGALLVLTVVTVLVSYFHLPRLPAILIGLSIAAFKASLVGAFFMHLKGEKALIFALLGATFFFVALLFLLPFLDSRAISEQQVTYSGEKAASTGHAHVP
ncbi:MAG: cytochrome C oxidase subunit IV family protein [Elusimicrobia bacterium]|nr:cytochrome C oxidase subunit IV family protein [Elusimicrobiota bacterium]